MTLDHDGSAPSPRHRHPADRREATGPLPVAAVVLRDVADELELELACTEVTGHPLERLTALHAHQLRQVARVLDVLPDITLVQIERRTAAQLGLGT